MASAKPKKTHKVILLVEDDIIIRLGMAEYLRACGFGVIEASGSKEARTIIIAGPKFDILISDAQLAGEDSGFALAQWVRQHRTAVKVILTATTAGKIEAAGAMCTHTPHHDAKQLEARIRAMMSERARRARPPASSAVAPGRRRKSS